MALTPTVPSGQSGEKDRSGSDEAFLREVDDAVRASDLTHFWKRYGRWLLIAVGAGLLAFAGYIFWQNRQQAAADLQSEAFVTATDKLKAGDDKGGRADLAKLVNAPQAGYRAMALLVLANLDGEMGAKNNDPAAIKSAIAGYAKVAGDSSLPKAFRDLALVRQTAAELDTLAPQIVIDRLRPLAVAGNPWFGSAGEMTAISYMKLGKDDMAGPIFAQISKQEDAPTSLRSRAQQMAGALGVDAVQINEKQNAAPQGNDGNAKGTPK